MNRAQALKDDEYYTLIEYVEQEMWAYHAYNPDVFRGKTILLPCDDPEWSAFTEFFIAKFDEFGIEKLVSTSFNKQGKQGKLFTLKRDHRRKKTKKDDLEWTYLKGTGDFRSAEVTKLRDEADFVITNPPFSLQKEFLPWVLEGGCQFSVIGNLSSPTYKSVFPAILDGRMFAGASSKFNDMVFIRPEDREVSPTYRDKAVRIHPEYADQNITRLGLTNWFTNIPHHRREKPLDCRPMKRNLAIRSGREAKDLYKRFLHYDAIEVPAVKAIPSDYKGVMAVPLTYLASHCPEQFEIVGVPECDARGFSAGLWSGKGDGYLYVAGAEKAKAKRLFIRAK